jgi:hypothetical protein
MFYGDFVIMSINIKSLFSKFNYPNKAVKSLFLLDLYSTIISVSLAIMIVPLKEKINISTIMVIQQIFLLVYIILYYLTSSKFIMDNHMFILNEDNDYRKKSRYSIYLAIMITSLSLLTAIIVHPKVVDFESLFFIFWMSGCTIIALTRGYFLSSVFALNNSCYFSGNSIIYFNEIDKLEIIKKYNTLFDLYLVKININGTECFDKFFRIELDTINARIEYKEVT